MQEAEKPEDHLYRVTFEPVEDMRGWDVHVLATSLGEAVEIATDQNAYRIGHPIQVRMLPVLTRDLNEPA